MNAIIVATLAEKNTTYPGIHYNMNQGKIWLEAHSKKSDQIQPKTPYLKLAQN